MAIQNSGKNFTPTHHHRYTTQVFTHQFKIIDKFSIYKIDHLFFNNDSVKHHMYPLILHHFEFLYKSTTVPSSLVLLLCYSSTNLKTGRKKLDIQCLLILNKMCRTR